MAEIGRRTTSVANLGPRSAAVSGVGRPKLEIAQELLENLRALGCTNSSHAASFPMDHSTESGGVWITLRKVVWHK